MKVGTDGVLLGAWTAKNYVPENIIDVGTGSGLIALMLAQRFPDSSILGIDIHSPSVEDARFNVENFSLKHQVQIILADFLKLETATPVDLIISNPPYFSDALLSEKEDKNRVRHQVHLTMGNFIHRSSEILQPDGKISLILPLKEMQETILIAEALGIFPERVCYVSSAENLSPIRMMTEFSFHKTAIQSEYLVIYEQDRSYTEQYKALTKEFYLHF